MIETSQPHLEKATALFTPIKPAPPEIKIDGIDDYRVSSKPI
jgi:hypothetical protein